MWPTWADIISKEMPDVEFHNFGISGSGNPLISYRIAEANNRYKFTDTDLIMVMFTTYCREDRWLGPEYADAIQSPNKGWLAGGNIYNNKYYPDSWVKNYADERGYLLRDAAVIDLTMKYLESIPSTTHCMLSVPFVTNSESCDTTSQKPYDIVAVYENTFNKFKPSMYELELRGNWKQLEKDYTFADGHPSPIRYYNYLEKLGFNLTDTSKQYATEMTNTLRTIENRQIVPLYFPEQDTNVTDSRRLLF
jgi:hypothetical protein